MKDLRYTLLSDGSSDSALIPVLTWLLQAHLVDCAIQHEWADLRRVPKSLKDTFSKRIKLALELYPCELLFIHRDAEKEPRQKRVDEIRKAKEEAGESVSVPTVCVVPVRMTEAWLLFDETALRKAAANPNGRQPLQLPDLTKLEDEPDPKQLLYKLLGEASELRNRRRRKLRVEELVHRVAEFIDDFASLRAMPAFKALEDELKQVIQEQAWCSDLEDR